MLPLSEAGKRFFALAGVAPSAPTQHPKLQTFSQHTDATQTFLRMNEERVAKGLPLPGSNGFPIGEDPTTPAPVPPMRLDADDFFDDAAAPGSINVKGYP